MFRPTPLTHVFHRDNICLQLTSICFVNQPVLLKLVKQLNYATATCVVTINIMLNLYTIRHSELVSQPDVEKIGEIGVKGRCNTRRLAITNRSCVSIRG